MLAMIASQDSKTYLFRALRAILAVSTCVLGACSMAPAIESSSLDYENTIEGVSNKSLVVNILRGRDGAPLYLTDLAQIRGGLTSSASTQAMIPYGPSFGSVQAGAFSASSTPSFDINPGNTRKFYQGIMNPVSKDTFEFYVARNATSHSFANLFYLLASGVGETRGGVKRIYSYDTPDFARITDPWLEDDFPLRLIKVKPAPKSAEELKSEPAFTAIDAKSLVAATSAGLVVKLGKDGKFRIESKPSEKTAICVHAGEGYVPVEVADNSTTKAPTGEDFGGDHPAGNACSILNPPKVKITDRHYVLYLRSVEQIFYYLGFSIRKDFLGQASVQRALFDDEGCRRLSFFLSDHPVEYTHFSVDYRGVKYYVRDNRKFPCDGVPDPGKSLGKDYDYTLQTLATLNELLNLNRDADEVATTKAVQTVGPR